METKGRKDGREPKPQERPDLRDSFDRALHPNDMGGRNVGLGSEGEIGLRTAYDYKELHRNLSGIPDDDLRMIPVLPYGCPLRQGPACRDLQEDHPQELTARGDMTAEPGHGPVPKTRSRIRSGIF